MRSVLRGSGEPAAPAKIESSADPAGEVAEQRESLDVTWYIDFLPATPIVAAGTTMEFWLRNSQGAHFGWEVEDAALGHRPIFTLREPNGRELVLYTPTRSQKIRYEVTVPGHYVATFRGRPVHQEGPSGQEWALTTTGKPISVSVAFDVSRTLGPEILEGEGAKQTEQQDLARLERPDAPAGEIGGAFQRVAARLGFRVLEQNRQEAEQQLRLYTTGAGDQSASEALQDLVVIRQFDDKLHAKLEQLALEPLEITWQRAEAQGHSLKSLEDLHAYRKAREARVEQAREALVAAFPALGVIREGELRHLFDRGDRGRRAAVELGLRRVLADIETTKQNLATGDLDILRVGPVVAAAWDELGIESEPHKQEAVRALLKAHGIEELERSLAVAGAAILLLFVPGIGPYLAAAVGVGWAARSWVRVGELRAAAGAGARGGLVERGEVARATFWAVFDTLCAGLDVGLALSSASKIVPHVPEAAEQVARVTGKGPVKTAGAAGEVGVAAEQVAVKQVGEAASATEKGVHVGGGPLRWEAPDGRVFTNEAAYRAYLKSGAGTHKALPAAKIAVPEGAGPGWHMPWTPSKHWNGPRNHGEWTGPRGNSAWIDDRSEVIRIVGRDPITAKANPIVYYQGRAHFSPYAQERFTVEGLVGTKVDSNADMAKILEEIARRKKLPSKAAARRWLRDANDGFGGKGLAPHHAGHDEIELIPSSLHNVQHTDITH